MEIKRNRNMQNLYSDHYSGKDKPNLENNNRMFNNNYSSNNNQMYKNDYGNYSREKGMHEYKGMDGKIYYTEQALDIANRMYLKEKNKRDNIN